MENYGIYGGKESWFYRGTIPPGFHEEMTDIYYRATDMDHIKSKNKFKNLLMLQMTIIVINILYLSNQMVKLNKKYKQLLMLKVLMFNFMAPTIMNYK